LSEAATPPSSLRFVKGPDVPIFCVVNGRRRHVHLYEWFMNELGRVPEIETIEQNELDDIPLGPACPPASNLRDAGFDAILHDPDLMRVYLGSLVSGAGIECGAGNRPLPIPLSASVRFVEAFKYGADESRSFPDATHFNNFMPVDIVDRIEKLAKVPDRSADFVIAAHMIEHTPNPIGAIVNFHRVCRDDGTVILIVPNRDLIFDRAREVTTVAHMLEDFRSPSRTRDFLHRSPIGKNPLTCTIIVLRLARSPNCWGRYPAWPRGARSAS
jgi:SAM-dependent methyltransferase